MASTSGGKTTGKQSSTSPKGGISSAELLTLLRHPNSAKESVKGARTNVEENYAGLEADFARLYLSGTDARISSSRATSPTSSGDNWGMASLAEMVSMALNGRLGPSQFGLDLGATGLKLDQTEPLGRSFVSPWFDSSSSGHASSFLGTSTGGLESVLPACYNVQPSPPVTSKIPGFADETLFYMFYAMPGDRMQDLAARELYSRTWRYHKELKIWLLLADESRGNGSSSGPTMISPDMSILPSAKKTAAAAITSPSSLPLIVGDGPRQYTVFDPQSWSKISKELPVRADQLEDRFAPGKQAALGSTAPAATPVLLSVHRNN